MKAIKKILCLIICIAQVLVIVSCSGKSAKENSEDTAEAKESASVITVSVSYQEQFYPFSGDFTVDAIARLGEKILTLGSNSGNQSLMLCEYSEQEEGNINISNVLEVSIDGLSLRKEESVCDITAGGDGFFYILVDRNSGDDKANYEILKYDENGSYVDVTAVDGVNEQIKQIHVTEEGKIVLRGSGTVYIGIWGKSDIDRIQVEGNGILSSALCNKGVILSVFTGNPEISPYYAVDADTGEITHLDISNPYEFGSYEYIELYTGSLNICTGLAGEYIINTGTSFIQCDFDHDTTVKLYPSEADSHGTGGFGPTCRLNENSFAVISNGVLTVTGMKEVPYVEKSIVKTAVVGMESGSVINEANMSSHEYEYQAVTYEYKDIEQFTADLISGNKFDLVLFTDKIGTTSEYYDDLYKYIDSSSVLSRDDFLPNLLESTSTRGELHQLWDKVCVTTIVAREADVRGYMGLSTDTYEEIVADNEKVQAVFDTYMSKNELLSWVTEVGISAFIDKQNGKCRFDDPVFVKLLSWCGEMGEQLVEGKEGLHYDASEVLLFPYEISQPSFFEEIRNYIGGQMKFVGFPDDADGMNYYSIPYSNGLSMAIPENSKNKEGAWAFIESRLSFDEQIKLNSSEGMPVNYKALRHVVESNSTVGDGELLYGLLNNTRYAKIASEDRLREIIISTSRAYISGDKSLDETVSLIQSRASTYMSERYG